MKPNIAEYKDRQYHNRAVCGECILAADPNNFKRYKKLRHPQPCWSCVAMIEEGEMWEEQRARESEAYNKWLETEALKLS